MRPEVARRVMLSAWGCAACGRRPGSVHHVIQKGAPHFGDDVYENMLPLCGSGTHGCHGAFHGNPYEVEHGEREVWGGPGPTAYPVRPLVERRDQEWVARRIGETIRIRRPDVIEYVYTKLGVEPGAEFLRRAYFMEAA